jgi:hypothetical protein
MPIVLTRSMKKRIEHVLHENVEIGCVNNQEWVEQPKIDLEEATTFHCGEWNKVEDVTKNIELKIIWPTRNHPPELQCIKIELEIPWELIWDPIDFYFFGTMRLLWQVHTPKRTKLIHPKGELMNYVDFKGKSLLMRYKACNARRWAF